ncbi:hypothetical protein BofuT4_uP056210.1 [Botrytis cinerea T4]|uniref:Uncharacterized protein n=1 Tax=Botryotinia fuckeliana (strain T4) TaxID=999810 RepID=G2XW50_BOTF4|nr:hypothetical protein BofuT4_uP056210.1 [Botrytis cinerea T4]
MSNSWRPLMPVPLETVEFKDAKLNSSRQVFLHGLSDGVAQESMAFAQYYYCQWLWVVLLIGSYVSSTGGTIFELFSPKNMINPSSNQINIGIYRWDL